MQNALGGCVCRGQSFRRISRRDHRASFVIQTLPVFLSFGNTIFRSLAPAGDCSDFISTVFFYIRPEAGAHITFLYFRSGLYACRRILSDRPWWDYCFYKRRKQKDVVVQQSKTDRLPFESQYVLIQYIIYSYNSIYIYIYMCSTGEYVVVMRLIDP